MKSILLRRDPSLAARSGQPAWPAIAIRRRPGSPKGALRGQKLSDGAIAAAAVAVASRAKPLDNTDLDLYWRKEVVDDFVGYALREVRGDDVSATRLKIARQAL